MQPVNSQLKSRIHEVIFGFDTRAGRLFDVVLIVLITASVIAVMLDSVSSFHQAYGRQLYALEWIFTSIFTLEYGLRIYSSPKPRAYLFSFYGIVDLLSILPTYIAFLFPGSVYLIVIRILRVLRIFRILKLFRYIGEANVLFTALVQSRRKIFVFLFCVLNLTVVFGTLMFLIEGPENGFTSIPRSIYWAIVTITTVGYGDIAPHTPLGQAVAALAMISGYGVIAVPTGIVGAELINEFQRQRDSRPAPGSAPDSQTTDSQTTGAQTPGPALATECGNCRLGGHDADASFCKRCGAAL